MASALDALNALIGVAIPLLVGFLTKCSWPSWLKGLLMLLFSMVAAAIKVGLSGELDLTGTNLFGTFFVIAASAQITYAAITKSLAGQLQTVGPVKDRGGNEVNNNTNAEQQQLH